MYDNSLQKEIIIRPDENLDIYIKPTTETIALTGSSLDYDQGLPFEWGAGGDRQGKWVSSVTDVGSMTGQWSCLLAMSKKLPENILTNNIADQVLEPGMAAQVEHNKLRVQIVDLLGFEL